MENTVFDVLKDDFITIRYQFFPRAEFDKNRFNDAVSGIKKSRVNISDMPDFEGKDLLLYCIDTLFEIIEEKNSEKTCDFADTVHNMTEIPQGKRDIRSFRREIRTFRKKYGEEYFRDF